MVRSLITLVSLLALSACGSDPVDRAVDAQREALDFACSCGVSLGQYTDRAMCEADNPGLVWTPAQQACIQRVLDGAPSADVDAIECGLDAVDAQLDCFRAAGCEPTPAQIDACNDGLDSGFAACPQASEVTQAMFGTCGGDDG